MSKSGVKKFGVLILAAGQGTRMKSSLPKVLHKVGGVPMIARILRSADSLRPAEMAMVVGHESELVRGKISSRLKEWGIRSRVRFTEQKMLKGSGRAALESLPFIRKFRTVMILCGDSPLIEARTLSGMMKLYRGSGVNGVVLTARVADPAGYGRIVRGPGGDVSRITEDSELGPEGLSNNEINSGTYVFDTGLLLRALRMLEPQGPKKEFYLTDVVGLAAESGARILPYTAPSPDEILGVNSRAHLAAAEKIINARVLNRLMAGGVTVVDPANAYVEESVEIGADSVIYPGTHILGRTVMGRSVKAGPCALIEDCRIGDNAQVKFGCCLSGSEILEGSVVGPFSHVRPGCSIGPRAKIGNFSEVKASRVGRGSKVPHLSYIGDTDIAGGVNIGAGTITCNYDGVKKHKTVIEEGVFVGSNVNLVAPVKLGRSSRIGAGSTITEDVPDNALAIARSRQVIKSLR